MTWVKACKQYQLQRGEGAKYIVPKKGSDEYEIVKKIFESMEKPPKKEKTKKVAEPIELPPIKKTRVKKPSPESDLRKTIRDELIAEMKSKGLSLEVEVV